MTGSRGFSAGFLYAASLAGVVGGVAGGARALTAQEVPEARVLAVVDYVAGSDLYLAVGTDHGVRPSDTVSVYDGEEEGALRLGFFLIVSATSRRSVANILGEPFPVERGSQLYVGLPLDRVREVSEADTLSEVLGTEAGAGPGVARGASDAERGPTIFHGRVSADYESFRTVTRWGEDAQAESARTFSTPTFRLQAQGRNLPGGFSLGTGIRVSHRMSSDSIVQPVTSTRIYQLDLEKRFQQVPLELHLGRFYSPFDDLSGFWDGLLLRVGPDALGAGVAVGFEPRWSNEGFGSDRPKMSGFLDFDVGGETLDYSGSLTFLGIRPRDGLRDRTAVGLSQRVRVGRAWLRQRLEVDRDPSGSEWNLTRIQLEGSLALVGGVEAFGGWRRWRYVPLWTQDAPLGPLENRGRIGLSYWGRVGGGSVDLSLDRPEEGEGGRTLSGSFYLTRTFLPGLGVGGSASHWSRGEDVSLFLAPEVRLSVGRAALRGAYRFYRTTIRSEEITTHFGDASLTIPMGGGAYLRLQGSTQWGGDLSSNRLFASIWKGF